MTKSLPRAGTALVAVVLLVSATVAGLFAFGALPYDVYVVKSGSMTPTMPLASAVIVDKTEYEIDQPISFYIHGEVVTHRWVGTNEDGTLQTKGDANDKPDMWNLPKSEVIGGVVAVVPHLGFWIMYGKNPYTLGSLVCLALLIWLLRQPVREELTLQRRP
jgi:signal peptidase